MALEEEGIRRDEDALALGEEEPYTIMQSVGLFVGGITLTILGIASFYALFALFTVSFEFGLIFEGVPALLLVLGVYLLVVWWREGRR